MLRLVLSRSMVDLHRSLLGSARVRHGMRAMLEGAIRDLHPFVLSPSRCRMKIDLCKQLLFLACWYTEHDQATALPREATEKLIALLAFLPSRFCIPHDEVDRLVGTVDLLLARIPPARRKMHQPVLGAWATEMIPKLRHWRLFGMLGGGADPAPPEEALARCLRVGAQMIVHTVEEGPRDGEAGREAATRMETVAGGCAHLIDRVPHKDLPSLQVATSVNVLPQCRTHLSYLPTGCQKISQSYDSGAGVARYSLKSFFDLHLRRRT